MQICFPCSPARQVIRIFFIHHCQPLSWLRGGGAAWALSWTPGDLSIKRLPQAKKIDAESFGFADLSPLHPRHGSAAVSLSLRQRRREPKQEIFQERGRFDLLLYADEMGQPVIIVFFFFLCSCLDSPPIRIEYKQPVCNEAGDDSPALPFVGLRLRLPTASEMCLMCCDA